MFKIAETPKVCVEMFANRLREYLKDLICRAFVQSAALNVPVVQQVYDMADWAGVDPADLVCD
jgi:hypothetical protein